MKQAMQPFQGTPSERQAQEAFGSARRAQAFYTNQMSTFLNPLMQQFIREQEMVFIATADADGSCDSSFRAGPPGFVRIVNEHRLAYPEYRGNGVMASIGNMNSNPHIGMMFIDFFHSTIGLHVNGRARILDPHHPEGAECLPAIGEVNQRDNEPRPECWVVVDVEEAYIHCSKHIPHLQKLDKSLQWGNDDESLKGGDYFQTKAFQCGRLPIAGSSK